MRNVAVAISVAALLAAGTYLAYTNTQGRAREESSLPRSPQETRQSVSPINAASAPAATEQPLPTFAASFDTVIAGRKQRTGATDDVVTRILSSIAQQTRHSGFPCPTSIDGASNIFPSKTNNDLARRIRMVLIADLSSVEHGSAIKGKRSAGLMFVIVDVGDSNEPGRKQMEVVLKCQKPKEKHGNEFAYASELFAPPTPTTQAVEDDDFIMPMPSVCSRDKSRPECAPYR